MTEQHNKVPTPNQYRTERADYDREVAQMQRATYALATGKTDITEDEIREIQKRDELQIELDVGKFFKQALESEIKPYFDWELLTGHPLLQKPLINFYVAVGQRNIGKTWSWKKQAEKVVALGRRFAIGRVRLEEIESLMYSETGNEGWLDKNGWYWDAKSNQIKSIDSDIIVGYTFSLTGTAGKKSIDRQMVDLLILDEFSTTNMPKNKGAIFSLVELITTIQRHNPRMKILMSANYVDASDQMLAYFGQVPTLKDNHFIAINWLYGIVFLYIPNDIYNASKSPTNAGYRASLANYKMWKSQYGSGYNTGDGSQILPPSEWKGFEPLWNWKAIAGKPPYSTFQTFCIMTHADGRILIVDEEMEGAINVAFTQLMAFHNTDTILVDEDKLYQVLLSRLEQDLVFYGDYETKRELVKQLQKLLDRYVMSLKRKGAMLV